MRYAPMGELINVLVTRTYTLYKVACCLIRKPKMCDGSLFGAVDERRNFVIYKKYSIFAFKNTLIYVFHYKSDKISFRIMYQTYTQVPIQCTKNMTQRLHLLRYFQQLWLNRNIRSYSFPVHEL